MPVFKITGPDGKVYRVTGPEGSTPEQALARVQAQAGAQPQESKPFDPTEGMSGFEKFVAGYGSAVPRLLRGAGQRLGEVLPDSAGRALGLPTQADVDEANRIDAPLLATGAGAVGNILGNVAAAIPAVAIPGAATVPGAAAIGAAQGSLTPTSSGESALKNAAIGGAAGAGGIYLGRGLNSLYQGARSLVEPFTQAGRERIGGRVLQQFGVGADDVRGLSGAPTITGARPTMAEQIADPAAAAGAARLQGGLRAADPRASTAFAAREAENNAARVNTLRGLTGSDGGRDFAVANRAGTAGPMYQEAFGVDAGTAITPQMQREMQNLLRAPAIQQAAKAARSNAANAGLNVGRANGSGSIEGLHNVKLALDDMIATARGGQGTPAQETKARALESARERLVGFIERLSPEYQSARGVYAQMSRPINQMDVAGEVLQRGTSATSDLMGNPRLMPNALMSALSDEQALIRRATGRDLGGSLDGLMEPNQLAQIRGVAGEVDRAAAIARAENGPGSATAQRLASQNVLRQTLGPLGAPESWSESTLLNTLMRPVQFGYNQVAEPRIQQELAEALLDPSRALALIKAAQAGRIQLPDNAITQLAAAAARVTPSSLATNR
jgi:hypothetical protein